MLDPKFSELPEAVRGFRPNCPGCTPEVVMADGVESCSTYDCPGLPEQLQVSCNTCMYDFVTEEGQVKCDHRTCETAVRLKANVDTYKAWLELMRAEAEHRQT